MKSFLVKDKRPLIKWTHLPEETYFKGEVPEGYKLAISPHEGYIIVDVDRHGDKNGFNHLPKHLLEEFYSTLNYSTKSNGGHFWFKYTGNRTLKNTYSKYGIDLRTHKGYVVWYHNKEFIDSVRDIKETSEQMNLFIESLFA